MYSEKIKNNIINKNLIKDFDHLVIAVSGGPDSMCLLHYLKELTQSNKFRNLQLSVAHINHHTREIENQQEEELIKKYCHINNIPFYMNDFYFSGSNNFHDEARNFRYTFFKQIAEEVDATKIVLAHHLDDQVETVLFRLLRGTNLLGYSGIKEIDKIGENLAIIRPFLIVNKNEIIDYCFELDIPYLIDSSNESNKYVRNKIRHNLIPSLLEIQSDAKNKILQYRTQIEEASSYIDECAKKTFKSVHTQQEDGQVKLDIEELITVHPSIVRMVITYAINMVSKDKIQASFVNINTIMDIMKNKKPNITINLGESYYCIKQYNKLVFRQELFNNNPYKIEINEFREYILPNLVKLNVKNVEEKAKINNKSLFLCYNTFMWPLIVRTPQSKDVIKTKIGHKKLNRIFINNKIPKSERERWPIITDKNNNILWVVGLEKSSIALNSRGSNIILVELK